MCSSKLPDGVPTALVTTGPVTGSGTTVSIDASVDINKVTTLKYSIATLLLCASSVVTGIYTCFIVSTILSAAAVPVLFAAISVVAALVALSSTVYLIKSFVSSVNSERKIDLSEKKPDSKLGGNEKCKVPKEQQQNNSNANVNAAETPLVTEVPTSPNTLPVSPPLPNGAPSPPPLPLPKGIPPLPSGSSNSPIQPCNAGLSAEMKNIKLKKTNDLGQNKPLPAGANDKLASLVEELGTKVSNAGAKDEGYIAKIERDLEKRKKEKELEAKKQDSLFNHPMLENVNSGSGQTIDKDKSKSSIPDDERKGEYPTPQIHQPDNEKRSESPDSGNMSDDDWETDPICVDEKPFSTTKGMIKLVERKWGSLVKKECGASSMDSKINVSDDDAKSETISPLRSEPKAKKPPLPPKPANTNSHYKASR